MVGLTSKTPLPSEELVWAAVKSGPTVSFVALVPAAVAVFPARSTTSMVSVMTPSRRVDASTVNIMVPPPFAANCEVDVTAVIAVSVSVTVTDSDVVYVTGTVMSTFVLEALNELMTLIAF